MSVDAIFDLFNALFEGGDFEQANKWLEFDFGSIEANIAVLTATGCARSKLPGRKAFYEKVARDVETTGRTAKSVLHGLE